MSRKRSTVRLFPFLFSLMIVGFIWFASPAMIFAQPGGVDDIEGLKAQLMAIQAQLATIQSPTMQQGNSRVKSLGTQRTRRVPEPIIDDSLFIRLYDLSDIFAVSPHYPAEIPNEIANADQQVFSNSPAEMVNGGFGGGGGGRGGGGVFRIPNTGTGNPLPQGGLSNVSVSTTQVTLNQLVLAIKATVSPKEWGSGNDKSKIQLLGNTMLITATNEMHVQISSLLDLFREHWGKLRTITIQTYWIRADAMQARGLLSAEHQESEGAGVVEGALWKKFLEDARAEKRLAYSATLTSHDNQTVSAISGRQQQLTLDAIPFESTVLSTHADEAQTESTSIIGFKPVRYPFHHGAAIQVTPLATRGGNFVILDLHAKVNELVGGDAEKTSIFAQLPSGERAEVKIDTADYVAFRFNSTIRCPKEQVVMAGGMTYDTTVESDQPNLYLFVKATVHTIQEDKSDFKKAEVSK